MEKLDFLPQDSVIWGRHALRDAVPRLEDYGIERPMIFTVEPLQPLKAKFIEPNVADCVGTFLDLPPHVPDHAVQHGLDACLNSEAGSIIALGGGSVLDAAKAVSHFFQLKTGRYLPIAALPTTLSGSEFSHYFGVTETNGAARFKRSYAVRGTAPRVVIIDPELIRGTPRSLLLSSAIKGIDHAVEGMRLVGTEHPHAILAASGVERFLDALRGWPKEIDTELAIERGLVTPEDLLQLQLAAWQSYFYPASVIYGLSHRIGHILGGTFGLPHSMTSCITLAPVIRACSAFYGEKMKIFADATSGAAAAQELADAIEHTVTHLGLPTRLRDVEFDRDNLAAVATLLLDNYPTEVGDLGDDAGGKLRALLEELW